MIKKIAERCTHDDLAEAGITVHGLFGLTTVKTAADLGKRMSSLDPEVDDLPARSMPLDAAGDALSEEDKGMKLLDANVPASQLSSKAPSKESIFPQREAESSKESVP